MSLFYILYATLFGCTGSLFEGLYEIYVKFSFLLPEKIEEVPQVRPSLCSSVAILSPLAVGNGFIL